MLNFKIKYTMMEFIGFIGCVLLLFVFGWFFKVLVESIILNVKDIFGPVVNDIVTSIKK